MWFHFTHRQDAPSLADIVVGVTARAIVASLGETKADPGFGKVRVYAQQVGELDACAKAAAALAVFTDVSSSAWRGATQRIGELRGHNKVLSFWA